MIRLPLLGVTVLLLLHQAAPSPFRSGVEIVRVNVFVTERNRPVKGLTSADFELRDRGVAQKVDSVVITDAPVSMTLVLDTSESVKGSRLVQLKDAAGAALQELGAADRVSLMTFNSAVQLRAAWTNSLQQVRSAVQLTEAAGGTSLYDAAFAALVAGDTIPDNRHLILLFSDGMDTSSWLPPSAVIERARSSDAVVYSVALAGKETNLLYRRSGLERLEQGTPQSPGTPFLAELAKTTGGASLVASDGDLRRLFAQVVGEFRTRYLLAYTPRGVEMAGWHPIDVKLKNKGGKIIARRGYQR
jgi:VWFA-related protein